MDPDSSRRSTAGGRRAAGRGTRNAGRLQVTVSDGRGRSVRDGGLARWLAGIAPARARGDVAVAFVSDAQVLALNSKYRKKQTATDVLSFPAASQTKHRGMRTAGQAFQPQDPGPRTADPGPRQRSNHLGDIVIATGVARRQARSAGHSYQTELRVLALHGLLHLLGYDHENRQDAGQMSRLERRLRRRGGLPAGLIERS